MCAGWCVPTCSRACVGALCVLCVPAGMWTWCGRVLPFVGSLASAGVSFRYRQSPPEGTPHRFLRASYLKAEIHMAFALYPTAHQLVLQSTIKENSDLQQRAKQSIFQNSGLTFAPLEAGPPRKPWWGGLGPAASPGAASPGVRVPSTAPSCLLPRCWLLGRGEQNSFQPARHFLSPLALL